MNGNGQRRFLNHIINKRQDPANAGKLQAEFDAWRRKRLFEAATTRPVFHPLQFNMTAAAQTSPYRDTTQSLGYDVLITGIKADVATREIIIRRTESDLPICYVGDETDLNLRVDDIAGITATVGGGQTGAFYLPSPIPVPAQTRLTIEMFKTDVTAAIEQANIVLIGVRVFHRSFADALLDPAERMLADQFIAMREVPRTVFLKQLVEFDTALADGEARNLFTPKVEEPLLIRGVRTTLRQSQIEIGVTGEPSWTVEPTPIWGVAGEDELGHDNYQWFSKPIYLHSGDTIEVRRIINSIDGTLIDAQTGNTLTWICETA